MKGSTKIALAIGIVVFAVVAMMGFRYLERDRTAARLIGSWEQENSAETLKESLDNLQREGRLGEGLPDDTEVLVAEPELDEADEVLGNISLPIGRTGEGVSLSLRTEIRFEEGGHFVISVGDRESKGHWVLSNAKGKRKTVVARVMQTPTFEQRLIIHLEFQGKDTMIVSDEAGVKSTFVRQ